MQVNTPVVVHPPVAAALDTFDFPTPAVNWVENNAAPDSGDTASSHVAGLTVDISRRGMGRSERKWMEEYLLNLKEQGLVETAEERREPVFHIMVAQKYAAWRAGTVDLTETSAKETSAPAESAQQGAPAAPAVQ